MKPSKLIENHPEKGGFLFDFHKNHLNLTLNSFEPDYQQIPVIYSQQNKSTSNT